jgi:sulfite exporter TauE/SafE
MQYTTESLRKIEQKLKNDGITVSYVTIGEILGAMGYSKQTNQKMLQVGTVHPDRNVQFEHIKASSINYIYNL